MTWGDQWLCPCGTGNLFIRARCRSCGEAKLPDEKLQPWHEVIRCVEARNERGKS